MPSANNTNTNDGGGAKDGIMDRLAKTLFASPSSPLTAFADRQRVERLEQCQQFERILEACQSASRNSVNVDEQLRESVAPVNGVPNSRSGERITRFFGWNSRNSSDQQSAGSVLDDAAAAASMYNGEKISEDVEVTKDQVKREPILRTRFSEGCAIETHELWACRALAVGCGNHLAELRQCWSNANAERSSLVASKSKEEGIEFYNEKSNDTSCRNIQLSMARCVHNSTAELQERVRAAELAKKQ
jgi:hypothetical protein